MKQLTTFLLRYVFRVCLVFCLIQALTSLYVGLGLDVYFSSIFGYVFSSSFTALVGVWDFNLPESPLPEQSSTKKIPKLGPDDFFSRYPFRILRDIYGTAPSVWDSYNWVSSEGTVYRIVVPGTEGYHFCNSVFYYLKCLTLTAAFILFLIILYKGPPDNPYRVAQVLFHIEELLQAIQIHGPGYEEFMRIHQDVPVVQNWQNINALRLQLPNARPVSLTILEAFRDFLWEHAPPEFFEEIERNRLEDLERWQPPV